MKKNSKLFRNLIIDKNELKKIILWSYYKYGRLKACSLLDHIKDLGFFYSTKAGVSLSIEDLRVPPAKPSLIRVANEKMKDAVQKTESGEITEVERFQKIINLWNQTSESLKTRIVEFFKKTDPLNSIYMMSFSGARGNLSQVRQLIGMRGLMSSPSGEIIDLPISSNFREGLTITDYIISAYGARKGLVDTSLKTADSGYLTRRLIDVAQDIIIKELDCNSLGGIKIKLSDGSLQIEQSLIGRVLAKPIYHPITKNLLAKMHEQITPKLEKHIKTLKISNIYIRSPLTCESDRSICQQCYGWDLSSEKLIQLGEAVGILAAQSIGEPGTQLTMRTFHTGGVFTREQISRQICSKVAGQIFFSKNLPLELRLTQYGEVLPQTKILGKMFVIDYQNQVHILKVFANTILLIKDRTYLQQDEPLMELPSNKSGEKTATKYITAEHSGEIIFKENPRNSLNLKTNNKLIWILSGQRYIIPIQSELNVKPLLRIRQFFPVASTKIINFTSGIVFISPFIINNHIESFQILQYYSILNDFKFFLLKTKKNTNKALTAFFSKKKLIQLQLTKLDQLNQSSQSNDSNDSNDSNQSNNLNKFTSIGHLENLDHYVKAGGILCFLNYRLKDQNFLSEINGLKKGCTVLHLPEINYPIYKDKKGLKVKIGDLIKSKKKEIFTNIFSSFQGTVDFYKSKKIIKKIKIKPGKQLLLPKKYKLDYKKYHQQIYYPGENLFGKYEINRLSYGEIFQTSKKIFLLLRPLIRYEIVQTKINFPNLIFKNKFNFEIKICELELALPVKKFIKVLKPLNLSKQVLQISSKIQSVNSITNLKLKLEMTSKNYAQLNLIRNENLLIEKIIPKEIEKIKGFFIPLVENKQFVEPYTILATINVLNSQKLEKLPLVYSIKELKKKKNREILLIRDLDYQSFFFEDKYKFKKTNYFLKKGEKIGNNLISSKSGIISNFIGSKLLLRLAQPYLFSEGATIKRNFGFVHENEQLGQILYERERTHDIVQGLPKIEEFLEARKPKIELIVNPFPGIITKISDLSVWIGYERPYNETSQKSKEASHFFESFTNKFIQKFQFINVAQTLDDDIPINPHLILKNYYYFYERLKLFTSYESAYHSFKKVQGIILGSVQKIYHSQGVYIADKHLELIIRKMTRKVKVLSSGATALLFDEIVDLTKVDYINRCINSIDKASFEPTLLGITKASLKTDSFISAASFQETTKVLTEASIHGKTDWLEGLKENVIVGRLIPAGTAFNIYTDVSNRFLRIPSIEKLIKLANNEKKEIMKQKAIIKQKESMKQKKIIKQKEIMKQKLILEKKKINLLNIKESLLKIKEKLLKLKTNQMKAKYSKMKKKMKFRIFT